MKVLVLLQTFPNGRRNVFVQALADERGLACIEKRWFDGKLNIPVSKIVERPNEVCVRL